MTSLNKPFDLLFKHTLGSDIALQDFVRHHLPVHVYQRIGPHSIRTETTGLDRTTITKLKEDKEASKEA